MVMSAVTSVVVCVLCGGYGGTSDRCLPTVMVAFVEGGMVVRNTAKVNRRKRWNVWIELGGFL